MRGGCGNMHKKIPVWSTAGGNWGNGDFRDKKSLIINFRADI